MTDKLFPNDDPRLLANARAMRRGMTEAEARLWQHLRAGRLQGYKFRRQQPIGNYVVDFVCTRPKLVIEADGGQHGDQAAYDHMRDAFLRAEGFAVLRFWNHDILQQIDAVLAAILQALEGYDAQKT